MITPPKITPFLWYGGDAEQAAEFYVSLIPDSRIVDVQRQEWRTGPSAYGGLLDRCDVRGPGRG